MKKFLRPLLLLTALLTACIILNPTEAHADGTVYAVGPPSAERIDGAKYYQLDSVEDLYWFAEQVNSGNSTINAILTKNIIVNEGMSENDFLNGVDSLQDWTPIGNTFDNKYLGIFDGNSYIISGLYSNDVYGKIGFFGYNSGTVKNVVLINSYFSADCEPSAYVGGICAYNDYGIISNAMTYGVFTGDSDDGDDYAYARSYIGGICGWNSGTIEFCCSSADVTAYASAGSESAYPISGGICGNNSGTINKCYNSGSVTATGRSGWYVEAAAGGICGENTSGASITDCCNTGDVSSTGEGYSSDGGGCAIGGGVCGTNYGTITFSFNTGYIVTTSDAASSNYPDAFSVSYTGGISGTNSGTVKSCKSIGGMKTTSTGGDSDVYESVLAVGKGTATSASYTAAAFSNGTVCTAMTYHCYKNGVCTLCGLECINHQLKEDYQICTVSGVCDICNLILEATGHAEEIVPGKAATETEPGLTEGKKCAVCGEILVAQEVIPARPQTATEGYLTFTLNEDGLGYSVTDCDISAAGAVSIPATFSGLPVTAIGYCAFHNRDSLTEVVIPDSVTAIAGSAFWDCASLTAVHIPDSVTGSIGQRTFARCEALTDVTIGKGITSIDHYAFYNCTSLKTITIPDGVTSIGYQVFQGCNTLATVSLPDTLTDIGENAFSGCYRLANITIPDSVQSIGTSAFSSCTFLTEIVIPEGITRVEKRTFYGCTRLTKVTIPQSVTAIGDYAFSGCTGLTDVYYSGTRWDAVTIGNYNVPLTDATLHIPDACADGHTYGNDFDADCNICGEVRELNNTFKFENYRVVFADPDTTHKNLRVEVYKLGDKTVEDPTDEKALKAIDASPATHWGAGNINKILITEAGNYVLLLKYNIGTGSAIKVPLQISVSADPKLTIDKNNKLTAIDNDGANINHRVVVYYLGDKTVEDIYDEAALTAIDAAPETIWQKTRINRLALTKGGNYVLHLCYNVGTGNKMTVAQQFTVESIPTLSVNINNRVVVTEENAENKNHRAVAYYLGENTVDDPYSESAVKAAAISTSKTYWGLKEINGIEMKEGGNYIVHLYYNVGTSEKRTLALDVTLTERPALSVDENNKLVVTYSDASITNPRAYIYNLGDKMVGDLYDEAALKAITTPTQVWGLSEILRKTLTEPGQYVIHLHYNVGTGAKKTVALQVTI